MDNVFRDLSQAVHSEAELALGMELAQRFEMLVARYMHAQEVLENHSPGDTHARRYAKGGLGKFGSKTDLASNTSPMLASILIEAEVPSIMASIYTATSLPSVIMTRLTHETPHSSIT